MNPIHPPHMGPPKTGTSSLEQALNDERSMLGASGTLYAASAGERQVSAHEEPFYEISGDQRGHGEFDAPLGGCYAVLAEIDTSEGRSGIISSGGFQYFTDHVSVQVANRVGPRNNSLWISTGFRE